MLVGGVRVRQARWGILERQSELGGGGGKHPGRAGGQIERRRVGLRAGAKDGVTTRRTGHFAAQCKLRAFMTLADSNGRERQRFFPFAAQGFGRTLRDDKSRRCGRDGARPSNARRTFLRNGGKASVTVMRWRQRSRISAVPSTGPVIRRDPAGERDSGRAPTAAARRGKRRDGGQTGGTPVLLGGNPDIGIGAGRGRRQGTDGGTAGGRDAHPTTTAKAGGRDPDTESG